MKRQSPGVCREIMSVDCSAISASRRLRSASSVSAVKPSSGVGVSMAPWLGCWLRNIVYLVRCPTTAGVAPAVFPGISAGTSG